MNTIYPHSISRRALAPVFSPNEIPVRPVRTQQPGLAPKRLMRTANATIDQTTFDLSVKNPDGGEEVIHRSPQDIMDEIAALDLESAEVLEKIKSLL